MIGQLIQITTERPRLEINVTRPVLNITRENPSMTIVRHRGGLRIHSEFARFTQDMSMFWARAGVLSAPKAIAENARKGIQAAQDAAGAAAQAGDMMMDGGDALPQIAAMKFEQKPEPSSYVPYMMPQVSWLPAQLKIDYMPDTIEINFSKPKLHIEFTKASVSYSVSGRSKVTVNYLGKTLMPHRNKLDLKG